MGLVTAWIGERKGTSGTYGMGLSIAAAYIGWAGPNPAIHPYSYTRTRSPMHEHTNTHTYMHTHIYAHINTFSANVEQLKAVHPRTQKNILQL